MTKSSLYSLNRRINCVIYLQTQTFYLVYISSKKRKHVCFQISQWWEASKKVGRLTKNFCDLFFFLKKRNRKKKSCFSGEENKLQGKREVGAVMIGQNSKFLVLHKLNSQD